MDVFVGIDVAKDRLDICVRPGGEIFVVARDDEGLEHLVERLRLNAPLTTPDPATFYAGGPEGYTDYKTLAETTLA